MPWFAKPSKSIIDIIDRHRASTLAGEQKSLREILRAYESVDGYLRAKLDAIEKMIATAQAVGDDPGYKLFEQARYRDLIDQVEKRVDAYATQVEGKVKNSQRTAAITGTKNAVELLKVETQVKRIFTTLNPRAIETMVGALSDGSPLKRLFGEMGNQSVIKAREIMVTGIASGENPRRVAVRLAEEIKDLNVQRATVISRNETLRVLNLSQQRTYEANSYVCIGSQIFCALDSRTCPLCWARHGTILAPGEDFPRHVCCRCTLIPFTKYSPKRATGDEEFALISEERKLEILGAGRYNLYKEGRISLGDLYKINKNPEWGPELKSRTITQITKSASPRGSIVHKGPASDVKSVVRTQAERGIVPR